MFYFCKNLKNIDMATVNGKYEGNLRNELTSSDSGNKIITDAATEIDGKSKHLNPTDLLSAALGACTMTMMGFLAKNHNFSIDGASYKVDTTMANEPRRVGQIDIIINFPHNYTEKQRTMLLKAADNCPVRNSLRDDTIVNIKMNFPE